MAQRLDYSQAPLLIRIARVTLDCDRRILYGLFALVFVLINLRWLTLDVPVLVTPPVQTYFDAIETLPTDKLVILDNDWGAGQYAENAGQYDATLRHVFARDIKVILLTWTQNPEAQAFTLQIAEDVAAQMNKEYGTDYVIFGPLTQAGGATISSLARDILGTAQKDAIETRDLSSFPIMAGVESIESVSMIARFAYMWELVPWIGFVQGPYGTKLNVGAAAITSSTAYPYVDAGQIAGLLDGASGAAQYEQLVEAKYGRLGREEPVGEGTATARIQSFAAAFVVLAILAGNAAFVIERRWRLRLRGER